MYPIRLIWYNCNEWSHMQRDHNDMEPCVMGPQRNEFTEGCTGRGDKTVFAVLAIIATQFREIPVPATKTFFV